MKLIILAEIEEGDKNNEALVNKYGQNMNTIKKIIHLGGYFTVILSSF